VVKSLTDKAFMIVIQDFQDPYTLNVKQLMKCWWRTSRLTGGAYRIVPRTPSVTRRVPPW
jgi:uncharacterized radical SAM superfamily Fe-S cluster-containing enzyme